MMKKISELGMMALVLLSFSQASKAQSRIPETTANRSDALYRGFVTPPESARPRVWWHWMNGNITWKGAKADMDWMKSIGIGGLQAFEAGMRTPKVVNKLLPYMSPGWKDVFRKTAAYADSLGLEFGTASSPGWSETGGPWVKPKDAMKKMSYAVTYVEGGKPFTGVLNHPPTTTGVYQTSATGGGHQRRAIAQAHNLPQYYKDQKVLAFRISGDEILPKPVITSSGGQINAAALSDGFYNKTALNLPAAKKLGGISWVQFDYGKPVTIRGLVLSTPVGGRFEGIKPRPFSQAPVLFRLEYSNDGKTWHDTGATIQTGAVVRTNSVNNVKARYFRFVSVKQAPAPPHKLSRWERPTPPPPDTLAIKELALLGTPTVDSFEEKAGFFLNNKYFLLPSGSKGTKDAIKTSGVLDLTNRLNKNGTLNWTPPAGHWIVLRIGYSLTGARNRPAPPKATGLEVDKLDSAAVTKYMNTYLSMYRDATNGLMGKHGLHVMMFDSWEAGYMNWTPKILEDFKRLRGYDPVPWLPTLAGYVVESPEKSDKFLFDWRRTIQQLLKDNHYDLVTKMLHKIGMIRYGEAHEASFTTMGDGMEMKQSANVPMGAMWQERTPGDIEGMYYNDNQESASVVHIYGQNIAGTESFTGGPPYGNGPWNLKPTADAILLSGSNRFVIHASDLQPITKGPGMTLGVGQMFSRNSTWAKQAKPWISYLARTDYMLQQGKAANDIAVFYGQESSMIGVYESTYPAVPEGYRYDYVNADVILNKLSVKDGSIVTSTGMNYKVLYFDKGTQKVTLPVLKKVLEMVRQGAVLVGTRPEGSPSLVDNPAEVKKVLDTLWPGGPIARVGKGLVFNSKDVGAALKIIHLAPDFSYMKPKPDSKVMFIHRHLSDGEIYFVANRVDRAENVETSYRVTGYRPELWDPATGETAPVSYRIQDGRTYITIPFDPFGSVFVVFRKHTTAASQTVPTPEWNTITTLHGPWHVAFQAGRGAPATATFDTLSDFRYNSNPGIRYFSGIATYSKEVQIPGDLLRGKGQLWLDLGQVNNLAEVWVNGKLAGTAWKSPYRVDISKEVVAGTNHIQIKSVNVWVNRIIGDAQPGIKHKITLRTSFRQFYHANSPLVPAGLIGPVKIIRSSTN